jgi:ABC-type lipoprotein release transport system permease subunit
MNLILDIAWTHVRSRVRQTGFAVAGVATGVGFSIMMAALMQGSQEDFTQRLVNALPHITVSDERRTPPPQPAELAYASAEIHGLTPQARGQDRHSRHARGRSAVRAVRRRARRRASADRSQGRRARPRPRRAMKVI